MAKICIIEDNYEDLTRRYGFLTKSAHEIQVVLDRHVKEDWLDEFLTESGFNPQNVSYGLFRTLENPDLVPRADLYFCDGLNGNCFYVADKVGKDKTWILTSDLNTEERAQEEGYNVVKGSLEKILEKLK